MDGRFCILFWFASECFKGDPDGEKHNENSANFAHHVIKVARLGIIEQEPTGREIELDILKSLIAITTPPKNQQT